MAKTFRNKSALQILKTASVVPYTARQRDEQGKLKTVTVSGCFALTCEDYPEANFSVIYYPVSETLRIISRWGITTDATLNCSPAAAKLGDALNAELKAKQATARQA